MSGAVIIGAARTAIGSFRGSLSGVPAATLGAVAIRGALRKSKVDAASVDEVIFGHVLQVCASTEHFACQRACIIMTD